MTDPVRVLPELDGPTGFFWTSGADGRLRLLRCEQCSHLIHPPAPYCPACRGRAASPAVVSGNATLYSFTVNHQPWDGSPEPYVIGIVEIEEQADVRLTTNIVDVDPDELWIGMPLEVLFEDHDPVHLPLFRPRSDAAAQEDA